MDERCILLSRVSTTNQTLEQQTNELIVEAHKMGYDDDHMTIIENHESAIKLSESERIGIQRMYDTINRDSKVDCVICYEVSRLSRRMKDLYSIRDFLIEHNVQLIILKPYLRLLDPDGKMSQGANLMFSLFSSMSESEMMLKKERMMRGKRQKIKECKYAGGNLALGYTYDKNKNIIIDEDDAKIVKMIFNMCENGESAYSISKYMYDRGMMDGENFENILGRVGQILRREAYTGNNTTSYPYPQIISKEQFDKCKEIRTKHRKPHSKTSMVYYGKSLIYNKANMRMLTPCKASVTYSSIDHGIEERISVNLNFIDSIIWQVVKDHVSKESAESRIKYINEKYTIVKTKIAKINRNLDKYEEQIDRIERRIIEGRLNEQRGNSMLDEISTAKQLLNDEMDELLHQETTLMNELIYASSFLYEGKANNIKQNATSDEERREIILGEVDKILIEKTSKFGENIFEVMFKDGTNKKLTLKCANRHRKAIDENGNEFAFEFLNRIDRKVY